MSVHEQPARRRFSQLSGISGYRLCVGSGAYNHHQIEVMKTLLVYYSFTGNNEIIAQELQERLACDLAKIVPVRKRTKFSIFIDLAFDRTPAIRDLGIPLSNYELLVFMSPIWAGKIASPLRAFLRVQRRNIHRYAFLSVCGGGQSSQKERVRNELTELIGFAPEKIEELWINNLVPVVKRNTLAVSEFRLGSDEAVVFQEELDAFVKEIAEASAVPSKG